MSDTQALIDEIAKAKAAKDPAAILAYEDHGDKKVRKAARKAIHVLRSKGVEIPDKARTWSGASLQDMRRHAGPIAMIDMSASPGVTRLTLSLPNDSDGAALFVGLLDPQDRVLDFASYYQTDGQQSRTARDWQRDSEGRAVDPEWVRARVLWAREQTFRNQFPVPGKLDDALPRLGQAPEARPTPDFLDQALAEVEPAASDLGEILMSGGVHQWPLLFDANELFERLGKEMEGLDPEEITNEDRLAHIMEASKGDEPLREALAGPFANALEDVAVDLWLDGSIGEAARVRKLTKELRESDAPETVDGVVNLVQLQVTAAAMEQMRQGNFPGQHDHDHDHDHDH